MPTNFKPIVSRKTRSYILLLVFTQRRQVKQIRFFFQTVKDSNTVAGKGWERASGKYPISKWRLWNLKLILNRKTAGFRILRINGR